MEFILEDGMKIILTKCEETKHLIAEIFNEDGEFLERSRIDTEDLYWKLF